MDEKLVRPIGRGGEMTTYDLDELIRQGYRRVSHKYGMIARIDRPDWQAFMELRMHRDLTFGDGQWEDYYRRVHSKDVIELDPPSLVKQVPGSGGDKCGYIPKAGDPPRELLSEREALILRVAELEKKLADLMERENRS